MPIRSLLIANRGEIAIRIARAAADLGIRSVAVYSQDDAESLHTRIADEAVGLDARGVPAYLDIEAIVATAVAAGCDAIHPGYGFLAENAALARACADAGITFVGPSIANLELFGDKGRARAAAADSDVPTIPGIDGAVTQEQAADFLAGLGAGGAVMLKALAGGGGRGTRAVQDAGELAETFERCRSEAASAFGNGALYVEQYLPRARHIEVQIVGDRHGAVAHVGERECSVQRRYQKIIEVAPAPHLPADLRNRITNAAVRFATHVGYDNLGTFEFLVDASRMGPSRMGEDAPFFFIETNARLQVEHTVTEAVTGVDLVQTQLRIAGGESLADVGLADPPPRRPAATRSRPASTWRRSRPPARCGPSGGLLTAYDAPSGPGVRTDGFGYAGYRTSPSFDSLLAKVITHSPSADFADAVARSARALSEFRIEGVQTNIPFLRAVLAHPDFAAGRVYTRFLDHHAEALAAAAAADGDRQRFVVSAPPEPASGRRGRLRRRADRQPRPAGAVRARPHRQAGPGRHGRRRGAPPDRPRRLRRPPRPHSGHDRLSARRRGRHRPRGPAGRRHGSDEDGARDQGDGLGHRARRHCRRGRRHHRGPPAGVRRGGRRRRGQPPGRGSDRPRLHPRRPAGDHRPARLHARREPAGGGRQAPQAGLPHAPGEHRAADRRGLAARVLAADRGATAPALRPGDAAQEHARRRPRRRHLHDQRRPLRGGGRARLRRLLRLHGPGRHAGRPQPLQAGPHVRSL